MIKCELTHPKRKWFVLRPMLKHVHIEAVVVLKVRFKYCVHARTVHHVGVELSTRNTSTYNTSNFSYAFSEAK